MKILILYGTLTLNTETVATELHASLQEAFLQYDFELQNVYDVTDFDQLKIYDHIFFGTPTWVDGAYPPDVEQFMEQIAQNPPDLSKVTMSFFGLGESFYEHYCQAIYKARDFFIETCKAQQIGEIQLVDGYPEEDIIAEVNEWGKKITEERIQRPEIRR